MKRKSELVVGLVTLLSLIILLIFTINIKKSTLFSKTYDLKVYFKKIKGLEIGAPVHVYGVIAGEVKNINYQSGSYPVMVTLSVKKKIRIFRNAIIRCSVAGLIGETKIEIDAGTPDTGPLQDGEDINGAESTDFTQVIEMTPTIMANISDTIVSIKNIFDSQDNQSAISKSLNHIESLTTKLDDMVGTNTQSIQGILENLNKAVANLNKLLTNANKVVADAKTGVSESKDSLNKLLTNTDARTQKLFDELNTTVTDTRQVIGKLDGVVGNNSDRVSVILKNLEGASQKLDSAVAQIESGNGTISLLLTDPQPFYDLKDSIKKIKQILGEDEKPRMEYDIEYFNSTSKKE